ncbi:D-inositol-3-phosphate glycosyltransferase [Metallosphaera sp. J1]|uniref:glycosyltransferase n=1 Tax=Metallosphaera javensis (ex Hofmann et al. 2022) TaxID=99938 RepID=UPI001EE07F02|nr:glycosyltransferase [Metallosphaera javensis (ex Hofmann et al. 2022)]MCG3109975.1 D-inositol-3-phosphate glycosyltransferase [Metallosphaera javensis (ex Hofmann et al. 2022)]
MKLGVITFSLTNISEGGAERHIREFIKRARSEFEIYLFPTLNTYLQIHNDEDRSRLINKVKELEKEGIMLTSQFQYLVDRTITSREYLWNFLDFRLLKEISKLYSAELMMMDYLFAPNFVSPDVAVMAKLTGKKYGILINGYIAPLHMGPLSYSRYKSRIGQEGFVRSLPKNILISNYWEKAIKIMRANPPDFVAGVNKVAIEGVVGSLPTNHIILDPGFAIEQTVTKYRREKKDDYALFVSARLEPSKGIFDLVKIMRRLRDNRINLKIMGRFKSDFNKFNNLAKKYGVLDKIEYLGFLEGEEKYKIISSAKVMVYPSHDDTNALVILESLAVNTPVIAYAIPGIRYAYDGVPGVTLVREFDYEAMANELRRAMSAKGLVGNSKLEKFILHHSSWERVTEQEINLILRHCCGH